jgi:hypothetical protein
MLISSRNARSSRAGRLSSADFIELSLRNHLCLVALCTEHRAPFHLGTIVQTMFDSFFLFEAGFGRADVSTYTDVDLQLSAAASAIRSGLVQGPNADAVKPISRLLMLFDSQLQVAPIAEIVSAHKKAKTNFLASPEQQQSIATLVQRSKRSIV